MCICLLLLGFFLRVHAITALPPFNDESHHIRRAEEVYTFANRDLSLTLGKLLSYYWIGFFDAARLDAIFIGRTSSALFALLGLAATFATARMLFGRKTALIALLLATFSPFMLFFDRLALTDGLTAAVGMWLIAASVRLMRGNHNQWRDRWAIFVGLLCGLVVIGKLLALAMIGIPMVALVCFAPDFQWRKWRGFLWHYRPLLGTIYGTFGLMMLPFVWHLVDRVVFSRQLVPVVNNNLINGAAEQKSPPQVVWDNLHMLWETQTTLHSLPLWLVMLGAMGLVLYRRNRAGLYLLGCIGLAWSISILVAAEMSTRYLTLGVLPLLVLVSSSSPPNPLSNAQKQVIKEGESPQYVPTLSHHEQRQGTPTPLPLLRWGKGLGVRGMLLTLWIALFAVPFIRDAWRAPTDLHLPARDQWEYFSNFSAGYGLVDAAKDIEQLPRSEPSGRVNVLALVGSCHQLRLYLDEHGPVWLECPFFGWQGEFMPDVARIINERLAQESIVYLLVEPELPYTDLTMLNVRWELVGRYPRPFDGMTVELYRIYPISE